MRRARIVLPIVCAFGLIGLCYGQTGANAKRQAFAKAALERVEKSDKATAKHKADLKTLHADWSVKKDDKSWKALNVKIVQIAKQLEIRSTVTISAVDGSGADQGGLLIKYKFVGSAAKPTTARQTTTAMEDMPIGTYNIWAERGGVPVSATDLEYNITKESEPVQVQITS